MASDIIERCKESA